MNINRNRNTMRSSGISDLQSVPSRPAAPPTSPTFREPNAVLLTMDEVQSPLSPKPSDSYVHPHRGCNRFGVPSQSAFFCRHNPHSQRARHIKGINGQPVCWVNDMILGRQATMCRSQPMTPESCLIMCGKIPTAAIGTNSNALPINTLTGLQFFPVKLMDTPTLKLLTHAWRDELRDLTERVGLLIPNKTSRGTSPSPSPSPSPHNREDGDIKLQLMLVDMLCQVLGMTSIREVQQWLLTAGQREKDHLVHLLCNALEEHQPRPSSSDRSAQETPTVRPASSNHKLTTLDEEDTKTRDPNEGFTELVPSKEEVKTKRARSTVTRNRQSTPRPSSDHRRLSSPAVCHLLSPPVLRYTKRAVTPLVPASSGIFQEQWSNYCQQSPNT
ncbi:protein TBATA [Sardina pilchardus]|uniref:protein TBATA n=1 Tax=Sardina pilchardus TaxID=27697 RepID=UPI002E112451